MLIKTEVVSSMTKIFGVEQIIPKLIGCFANTKSLLALGKACLEFLCVQAIGFSNLLCSVKNPKAVIKRYFKFVIEHFICISMAQAVFMGLWLKCCLALKLGYMS